MSTANPPAPAPAPIVGADQRQAVENARNAIHKAQEQYTAGNRLDRAAEAKELAQGLAECIAAGSSTGGASAKRGDAARAAFRQRIAHGTRIVAKASALTDQVHGALAKARQRKVDELNASTRRLQELFRSTDEMHARLTAFAQHMSLIQKRLRSVKAAKDKKYPRHLQVRSGVALACGTIMHRRVAKRDVL